MSAAAKARIEKDVIGGIAKCARLDALVIEGHTDRLGDDKFNMALSQKRADAVKAYLASKGIATSSIQTIGKGKSAPTAICPDGKSRKELIACLAPNRRVVVSIKGPGK